MTRHYLVRLVGGELCNVTAEVMELDGPYITFVVGVNSLGRRRMIAAFPSATVVAAFDTMLIGKDPNDEPA
jgi:hypothetical protein